MYKTSLYPIHKEMGAVMVEFAGYEMPLHYGSQIEEHNKVRQDAGMFDVSHMGIIDITGDDAKAFLSYLLANNIDKLTSPYRALYSCLLNFEGGVKDDVIVYYINSQYFRMITNAATFKKDFDWLNSQIKSHKQFQKQSQEQFLNVQITAKHDLGLIAVQGPNALAKVKMAFPNYQDQINKLKRFQFFIDEGGNKGTWLMAATGYTGEEGLEIILPITAIEECWKKLYASDISPIGIGARDTLRLEAGFNLYGQDMDESTSPFESHLGQTIALTPSSREFIGKEALLRQLEVGIKQKLIGLVLLEKGVLRHDQPVFKEGNLIGKVTSGSFSPTLKKSIGLARIPIAIENDCHVLIRHHQLKANIVEPPFVRRES